MFRQFVDKITGGDVYMIGSLLIFLVFFIVISLLLIRMNKKHINYMRNLPLNDDKRKPSLNDDKEDTNENL